MNVPFRVNILTIFPEMFTSFFDASILGRAREQGLLEIALREGKLTFRCNDPEHVPGRTLTSVETVLMEAEAAKPTALEMAHFIDCIETGATPETTPEESLAGLKVIWKLYEAEERNALADLRGMGF